MRGKINSWAITIEKSTIWCRSLPTHFFNKFMENTLYDQYQADIEKYLNDVKRTSLLINRITEYDDIQNKPKMVIRLNVSNSMLVAFDMVG